MLRIWRGTAIAAMAVMVGLLLAGQPGHAQGDSPLIPTSADLAGTVLISAGTYTVGRDDGPADERPAHQVALDAFRIAQYEVTNAQFAAHLNALNLKPLQDFAPGRASLADFAAADGGKFVEGDGRYPIIALDDENVRIGYAGGKFYVTAGYELHPVAETTWRGASDYCVAQGGRLPTEAEWEAAVRGRAERLYPWGAELPTPERAIYGRRTDDTAPVGSVPAGATPEGLYDMAGSLAEWTSSLYRPYPYIADDGREVPGDLSVRVTRGGDYVFDSAPEQLTTTFRAGFSRAPEDGHRHIGLRCVFPTE